MPNVFFLASLKLKTVHSNKLLEDKQLGDHFFPENY